MPLTVEGTAWAVDKRATTPKALAAKILCRRHNEALSGLDLEISRFYRALLLWHRDEPVGEQTFDGEDIERWALKAMLGFTTSGVARGPNDGERILVRSVPHKYLRLLFCEEEIEVGAGLYLIDQWVPLRQRTGGVSLTIATAQDERYPP